MSDDLIKRSDAIGACAYETIECYKARKAIRALPSADRPQGKWIIEVDVNGNTYGKCSICGMRQYAGQLNYCPNCGAKMKGADDEHRG